MALRLRTNSFVNKKLDFNSLTRDLEDSGVVQTPVLTFNSSVSPCHTRSGTVYKPKTLKFANISSDTDSDISDNVFEESKHELKPLDGFDHEMSPIVHKSSFLSKPKHMSPCFLRRRQRTSTRILPTTTSEDSVEGDANINPYSPVVRKRSKRHFSSSSLSSDCDSDDSGRCSPELPEKKLRVSDLSISRYEQEFVQMSELAAGEYGSVKLARHRLDGSDIENDGKARLKYPICYRKH